MEWLVGIEQLAPVRLLKSSFYAYPVVNAVHIAAIGALFTAVMMLDLRIAGLFRQLPERPFVQLLRRLALSAFAMAVLSGLALFAVRAQHYAALPVFLVKMALIALAGANFVAFTWLEGAGATRAALRSLAFLSLVLWTAVLLCGRFIGFL